MAHSEEGARDHALLDRAFARPRWRAHGRSPPEAQQAQIVLERRLVKLVHDIVQVHGAWIAAERRLCRSGRESQAESSNEFCNCGLCFWAD
jgi:hypothetical protein